MREWLFRFYLGIVVLAAAILLMWGSWYGYTSTFDTGTVGLMSVNIVNGERPLFFYGQPYLGALEAYLAAVFISLFGFSEFVISLAPISFTLAWIVFSYLLFTRIHNRTAGIVAAICAAFPGYYIWWFSVATHGVYPAILCTGTALLWISLRILQEEVSNVSLYIHALVIGILMATGIWIHPLTFPYIGISGILLVLYLFRKRFRKDIVLALIIIGVVSLLGFLPFYVETGSFFGGVSKPVELTRSVVLKALSYLFAVNNYELIVWNFNHTFESPLIRNLAIYSGLVVLFLALPLALLALVPGKNRNVRVRYYLIPTIFCLFFLAMYVQHHLAAVKAPRYTMTFLCMLVAMIWALAVAGQTTRRLKIFSWVLFGIWICYQVTGTVIFISGSHSYVREEQRIAEDLVQGAREKDLETVVIFGDYMQGLKGQILSMFAENNIAFVSADTERYEKNAQRAEIDDARGYLASGGYETSLQNILQEMKVEYSVEKIGEYYLFHDLRLPRRFTMRSIPAVEISPVQSQSITAQNAVKQLVDRNQDTTAEIGQLTGKTVEFDTGKIRNLCGAWFFTFQSPFGTEWKRPGNYELHVSEDGVTYDKVFNFARHAGNGFFAGPSFFVGGPWGKMEALFTPVSGRYVKILFPANALLPVTEVFFFETDGTDRPDTKGDMDAITAFVDQENLEFVLADRWVSARLIEKFSDSKKEDIAVKRFSTKYKNRPLYYFVMPEKGNGIVCDKAVAYECERTLREEYGDDVIAKREDTNNYSLFSLNDVSLEIDHTKSNSALLWNGHFPMQTRNKDLAACWLNKYGLPIWRPICSTVKGIYHDSWTNGTGMFLNMGYRIDPSKDKELHIVTHGWRPGSNVNDLQMKVVANRKSELQFKGKDENIFIYLLPQELEELDILEIRTTTFVPNKEDLRKLGLDVERVEIR